MPIRHFQCDAIRTLNISYTLNTLNTNSKHFSNIELAVQCAYNKHTKPTKPTEHNEHTKPTKPTQHSEHKKHAKPTEETEHDENTIYAGLSRLGCPRKKKKKFRLEPKQTKTRFVSSLFRFVSWNQKHVSNLYENNWNKQNCFVTNRKKQKQP